MKNLREYEAAAARVAIKRNRILGTDPVEFIENWADKMKEKGFEVDKGLVLSKLKQAI